MAVELTNISELNTNPNNNVNNSVFNFSNDNIDEPIFNCKNPNEIYNDKVAQDKANGFEAKDIHDVDKFFKPTLKSAIGAAMTYLISECAFMKCDKDGNDLLTSDEYNELITTYNFNISGKDRENLNDPNSDKTGNTFLHQILDLLSMSTGAALMHIPGLSEVKDAFVNTINMMIGIDENENGIIEKEEFSGLLEEKSTEPIPQDIIDIMYADLSANQVSGQEGLDIGAFTTFAFQSKLAWEPDKQINTDRGLSDFGRTDETGEEDANGKKKEAPMLV